ncbi:MAG: hypothetical protein ACK5TQ_04540 [Acetobacteraceae bacterium]|jgi:hypothetical protein
MEAPRPNTHLGNMLRDFRALAEKGSDLPSITEFCCAIGMTNSWFYRMLDEGVRRGFWAVKREGARLTAIHDPGGAWLIKCSVRRYRDLGKEPPPPARKCLRCRESFAPAHRTNFMCEGCRAFAAQAAP